MSTPPLKRLEGWAKRALAIVAAALFFRPGRRRRARALIQTARRILLVRIDDRLGEALLITPMLEALADHAQVDALVHARTAKALEGHPRLRKVLALDRRRLALGPLAPGIAALRRTGDWDVVVDCANWEIPSVTSALVARLVSPRAGLIGPAIWPTRGLHDVVVRARTDTVSEVAQRLHLLSPLEGIPTEAPLSFRVPRSSPELEPLLGQVRGGSHAILNPGGRLGWRRIPPEVFGAAARALWQAGRRPVVVWGPGEEPVARAVVSEAPEAVLAPATDLDALAALMAAAGCTVSNNTGPLHLSVAVGAPTLGLFLYMDPKRWGHSSAPHRMVDVTPEAGDAERMAAVVAREVETFAASLRPREPTGGRER